MPNPRTRTSIATVLLVFCLCFFVAGVFGSRQLTNDGFYTLYAGRSIVEDGLPQVDRLTVEGHGRAWIDQQWIAHVVFYEAYELGGYALVGALSAGLVASGYALLAALLLSRGTSPIRAVTWSMFAFGVASSFAMIRAQSFSFPLFVAMVWLLVADARSERLRARTFAVLPLLALWANVHGAVLLAAALVSAAALTRVVVMSRRGRAADAVGYGVVAAAAPAMLLATPYGLKVVDYYQAILDNPLFRFFIGEWRPLTPASADAFPATLAVAIILVLLGFAAGRGIRPTPLVTAGTVLLLLATLGSIRNAPWFAVIGALLAAEVFTRAWPTPERSFDARATGAIVVSGTLLLAGTIAALHSTAHDDWVGFGPVAASQYAADYLEANPQDNLLADDRAAAQILWLHPSTKGRVAFDTRLEVFAQDRLQLWFDFISRRGSDWYDIATEHDAILVDGGDGTAFSKAHAELAEALLERDDLRVRRIGRGVFATHRHDDADVA